EITNSRKYKVLGRAHREQLLQGQGLQLKDCVSSECAVRIGQLLDVGKIVTGSISKTGMTYYINAQLVNVKTGVVENAAYEPCEGCPLGELVHPTAIVAKKLLGLPYTPYKPKRVTEISRKEEIGARASSPGQQAEAVEWYNKGVELGDSSDQEIIYYKKAMEADPTFAQAYFNIGSIYVQRGMPEESVVYFKRFLIYCKDPKEKEQVRNLLAEIDQTSTPASSTGVVPPSTHTAEEWYNKGRDLNDNSAQEIEFYQKAIEVDPKFASAYYNLGSVYHTMGKYEEALAAYKKFMHYSNDYAEVERVREGIVKVLEEYLSQ
ncbi:MAG: tetratricopeptide repeat protein, partial [Deltaproteobacteria bacterium]